jgi:hypothetical protein
VAVAGRAKTRRGGRGKKEGRRRRINGATIEGEGKSRGRARGSRGRRTKFKCTRHLRRSARREAVRMAEGESARVKVAPGPGEGGGRPATATIIEASGDDQKIR